MKHIIYFLFILFLASCTSKTNSETGSKDTTITVTATAFNTLEYQTSNNPHLTAWQDTLKPGMKAIAVSRDLIPLGLDNNKQVQIEGLSGTYLVKDKMAARWSKKIDIYMGEDTQAANEWGEKEVEITFEKPSNID